MSQPKKSILHLLFRYFIFFWNRLAPILPDELFLKVVFRYKVGYWPNLKDPKTFCEKIQWLKLHNKNPEHTKMVDKIEAKKYAAAIIGEKYIIPTLGTWDSVDEIDWDMLPNQFVIKVTNDSGGIVICNDKTKLDINGAKRKLKKGWGKNYYKFNKEYPYKDVKPRIIAEKYMSADGKDLVDYKFYCFNGNPVYCQVIQDRSIKETIDFFDMEWKHQEFVGLKPTIEHAASCPQKPKSFKDMKEISKSLCAGHPFVRIDLYDIDNKAYFGEITFFPASGMGNFTPAIWNYKLGEMLNLRSE